MKCSGITVRCNALLGALFCSMKDSHEMIASRSFHSYEIQETNSLLQISKKGLLPGCI